MAYTSVRGRKPFERASKIAHSEIINNPKVVSFLSDCSIPTPAEPSAISPWLISVEQVHRTTINAVVAVDGGYRETAVRQEFPAASITFFTFGPLFFRLDDLRELDEQPFIAPEDLARLKRIERYSLVVPTRNISRKGRSLQQSVREALQEFLLERPNQDPPLMNALRWLLFREWDRAQIHTWIVPACPNLGCDRRDIVFNSASPDESICSHCGGPIYLVDALRLHERIDEDQGAGGILSYVITALEQIVLVHLIKAVWELRPQMLREILFIKDGPLAFFGVTAPLSRPMRELSRFLQGEAGATDDSGSFSSLLNAVGLEKSGPFVEHAIQIDEHLTPGSILILSNDYIARYIVPSDPSSPDPYGGNTYWAGKLIFKAWDGNTYVATVPTSGFKPFPSFADFPNLLEILTVVGSLRCSMYDNALIPIALANKLVSLAEFPSGRILENFARGRLG
jgi:hypothetical protein